MAATSCGVSTALLCVLLCTSSCGDSDSQEHVGVPGYDGILTLPNPRAGPDAGNDQPRMDAGTVTERMPPAAGADAAVGSPAVEQPVAAIGEPCGPAAHCSADAICSRGRCREAMQARYCHCLAQSGRPALLKLEIADVAFPPVRGLDCSPCMPVPTGNALDYRVYREEGSLERESTLDLDPSWNGGEVSIFSVKDGLAVLDIGCEVASFNCP